MSGLKTNDGPAQSVGDNLRPAWVDDIQPLFKNPYFVTPREASAGAGQYWYDQMKVDTFKVYLFDIDKGQQNNVYQHGPSIYRYLSSGEMPLPGPDFSGTFPPEAVELFRTWYNNGGLVNKTDHDPTPAKNPIPKPTQPPPRPFKVPDHPVWDASTGNKEDDIKMCFTNPCWIIDGTTKAKNWQIGMENFEYDGVTPAVKFNLQNYDHVKGWARDIYMHVASQAMPIEPPYFSNEAVEAIKRWYNDGCRQNQTENLKPLPQDQQIQPGPVPKPFLVRKDINTLSKVELMTYQTALLKLNTEGLQKSLWQVGGFLHSNWCLHYMQASFPWHRAHLLWLETQIGSPIPYWNFYSSKAKDSTHADSGIPQAFLDDFFTDAQGKQQKNPLKYALARNGVSRDTTTKPTPPTVQRARQLSAPKTAGERKDYIDKYVHTYLEQIYQATRMPNIGHPQNQGNAFTFASPDLEPINPNSFYQYAQGEFDGQLEQAHDNLHGWSGSDMANNSYAAFDPLFWSFHANFDRIFETWIRTHETQEWSSTFPLRPFKGRDGPITLIEGDPNTYEYTNIGDMVVNSKALGYVPLRTLIDTFCSPRHISA